MSKLLLLGNIEERNSGSHIKVINAYLHIVGDGEEYKKIQAKIEYKNLENKVCMHGYMKKECIDELYAQCDVYLMTSYTESFGFVLLEAMACGIPCVAFDSAQGAKEIIENQEADK